MSVSSLTAHCLCVYGSFLTKFNVMQCVMWEGTYVNPVHIESTSNIRYYFILNAIPAKL